MRISGGAFKGRVLRVPTGVRPTEGRVREALFSIWSDRIRGARFLDLFAGSGAVGLVALGRGAAEVVFVEADKRVARELEENAAGLAADGWRIVTATLPAAFGRLRNERFDLVFADAPYDFTGYEPVIAGVAGVLQPEGELAVEHAARVTLPRGAGGLELQDERRYGDSQLSIYGASRVRARNPVS